MGEKARRHGSGIAGGRSCRPARRSPEGRCRGEVRGAAYMGEKARHGSGLAETAPAAPQGTARRGRRRADARRGMHGEEAGRGHGRKGASWKRDCGGRSCRPARHSPKGTQGGGAGGSAPWKRACGGRSCRTARHSPKGDAGGRRGRKRAMEAGLRRPLLLPRKAQSEGGRRGERVRGALHVRERRAMEAGLREAAFAAPQAQPEGDAGENGCAVRQACMGGKARRRNGIAGGRSCRPARHSPKGQCRGRGARRGRAREGKRGKNGRGLAEALLPLRKAQPEGAVRGERCAARACMEGKRAMEAGNIERSVVSFY